MATASPLQRIGAPALFVLLWSTGFVGAKYGLPYAEPFTFLGVRMVVAAVLLALLAVALRSAGMPVAYGPGCAYDRRSACAPCWQRPGVPRRCDSSLAPTTRPGDSRKTPAESTRGVTECAAPDEWSSQRRCF